MVFANYIFASALNVVFTFSLMQIDKFLFLPPKIIIKIAIVRKKICKYSFKNIKPCSADVLGDVTPVWVWLEEISLHGFKYALCHSMVDSKPAKLLK